MRIVLCPGYVFGGLWYRGKGPLGQDGGHGGPVVAIGLIGPVGGRGAAGTHARGAHNVCDRRSARRADDHEAVQRDAVMGGRWQAGGFSESTQGRKGVVHGEAALIRGEASICVDIA